MQHDLKSWVGLFEPIATGSKTHDLRVMDRPFTTGDTCRLREWEPTKREYTGRECVVEITYITSGAHEPGHQPCAFSPIAIHPASCILSIKLVRDPRCLCGLANTGCLYTEDSHDYCNINHGCPLVGH